MRILFSLGFARFKKFQFQGNNFLFVAFFVLMIFRFHNAFAWNPYWGYDGGGHLDYIFSLLFKNKFPEASTNYLAWHEPFYYLMMAGLLKFVLFFKTLGLDSLLKVLGVFQALLSLATTIIIFQLVSILTSKKNIAFLSTFFIVFLPSFHQASTFITNELLNYFFIFLASYYFLKYFALENKKILLSHYFVLGILLGFGLLTKITVLILVVLIFFFLFWRLVREKNKKEIGRGIFFVALLIFLINFPWYLHKINREENLFSINNPEFLLPQALKIDERLSFFLFLDFNIFRYPYWYSGGHSFWSMLYADTFYVYYGSMENRDYLNWFRNEERATIARTTQADTFVTSDPYRLNSFLVWFGLPIFFVCILGLFVNGYRFYKKKNVFHGFLILLPFSFIAAIMYSAYRYPYYDFGIVKAIFIFPAFLFLLVPGIEFLYTKLKIIFYFVLPFFILYYFLIVQLYWVTRFGY